MVKSFHINRKKIIENLLRGIIAIFVWIIVTKTPRNDFLLFPTTFFEFVRAIVFFISTMIIFIILPGFWSNCFFYNSPHDISSNTQSDEK
jgi:hypothetical protein